MHREASEIDLKLYNMIEEYVLTHGYAPSYQEMSESLNMSKSTVQYHIRSLQIAGLIQRDKNNTSSRAIRLATVRPEQKYNLAEAVGNA